MLDSPEFYIAHDGTKRFWKIDADREICADCKAAKYKDFCCLFVPDEIWEKIKPTNNYHDFLCANCMIERLTVLQINVTAKILTCHYSNGIYTDEDIC